MRLNHHLLRTVCGIGAIILLAVPTFATQQPVTPRPEELIASLDRYIQLFQTCSFSVEEKFYTTRDPNYRANVPYRERRFSILLDGERMKMIGTTNINLMEKGKTDTITESHEWIAGVGQPCLLVSRDSKSGKGTAVRSYTDMSKQERIHRTGIMAALPLINGGTFAMNSHWTITEQLKNSKLSVRQEASSDRLIWLLEATSEWGNYSISFDPKLAFAPVRIHKRLESWQKNIGGIPLQSIPENEGGPCHEITWEWKADRIETIQGHSVVSAYTITEIAICGKNRTKDVDIQRVQLKDINLHPTITPDSFAISTPIPNGAPASIEGKEMIRHEWRDGKIVKNIDQESVANLEGNWFESNRGWRMGLLTLAVLAVAGIGFYWWRSSRTVPN